MLYRETLFIGDSVIYKTDTSLQWGLAGKSGRGIILPGNLRDRCRRVLETERLFVGVLQAESGQKAPLLGPERYLMEGSVNGHRGPVDEPGKEVRLPGTLTELKGTL